MDSKKFATVKDSCKSDTRYYDELFTRLRDDNEFKEPESFGKNFLIIQKSTLLYL